MPVLIIILLVVLGPTLLTAMISLGCKISEKSQTRRWAREARIREQQEKNEALFDESQRAALLPMIATETQSFIEKVNRSKAFEKIAEAFLQNGVPYIFHVSTEGISCCDSSDRVQRRIRFVDLGLPNLVSVHRFSQPIDSSLAWRRGETLPFIQKAYPNLFGFATYPSHGPITRSYESREEAQYDAPCIDERIVIGVLLCQKARRVYNYKSGVHVVTFTSTVAPPDKWQ